MRFRSKIFAVLTVVGLLPLALLGFLSFSVNRAELERTSSSAQEALAQEAARGAEHWMARGVEGLRLSVSILPFGQLRAAELSAALHIPYGQLEFIDALALVDDRGRPVVPLVNQPRPGSGRPPFAAEDVPRFLAAIPVDLALQAGTALGAPYAAASGEPHVAVAIRVSANPPRVVAAQFSLRDLQQDMREIARAPVIAYLEAADGGVLASAGPPEAPRTFAGLASAAAFAHAPFSRVIAGPDGARWLASAAPVGGLGWTAVLAQPTAAALRPALRVRNYTVFWAAVALLLTGALGLLVSRSLTVPIHQLKTAARALQEGRYQEPVGNFGRDELGELAQAFGHMSREIRRRDEEIRAWNADLQKRVEEKGEELKAAQDQILRARRLAAMGSLGAGVAHEINNPLMAIAGFIALLERDGLQKQVPTLKKAQEQVQRVARIVEGMLQFTTQERAVQGRKFALAAPVRSVLQKYAPQLDQTGIELSAELDAPLREAEGDPVQIEQVVEHLVRNAIQAMPGGGRLHVSLAAVGGDSLKLVVADTGRGIAPGVRDRIFDPFFSTKDGGKGAGLGLSISHSIVEAHHGRILVDSVEGRGATFTVVLPAAAAPAHLS
jgi:two-component system, NtrC family, sensor kinase